MRLTWSLLLISSCFLLFSCDSNTHETRKIADPSKAKEPLLRANQHMVRNEDAQIDAYIARYGWPMNRTGTGLRYWIYKKVNGESVKSGDKVKISYRVTLLNGEVCYDSRKDGNMGFEIDKGGAVNGLHEGIILMHTGEKAKFIVPSHLAFGLLGDQQKIPQRATLIYDIEFLSHN